MASTQDKPGREPRHTRANRESGRWTLDAGLGLGIFPENMEKLGL